MKRTVEWSELAISELQQQVAYIKADNPVAARGVRDRIASTAANLGEFATGRPGRVAGTYEQPVRGGRYIIVYRLLSVRGSERVQILRVIHTARDWP